MYYSRTEVHCNTANNYLFFGSILLLATHTAVAFNTWIDVCAQLDDTK